MIRFKTIEIEGMGSIIERAKYKWDRKGLNLIKGPNGVGKTTILNALAWCAYGKKIKKNASINPWPHLIDETYKGTFVRLTYVNNKDEQVELTHCNEYKGDVYGSPGKDRLVIKVDNRLLDKLRDKKDGWKWIIEDLGASFELFKSSVLFGQKVTRLLDEDGPNRNKILEEAYEASFISQAKNKIDQNLRMSKPALDALSFKVGIIDTEVRMIRVNIEDLKKKRSSFNEDQQVRLERIKSKIAALNDQLAKAGKKEEKIQVLVERVRKIANRIESLKSRNNIDWKDREFRLNLEVYRNQEKLDELKGIIDSCNSKLIRQVKPICNECGQPINREQEIKQRKKLKSQIAETQLKIDDLMPIVSKVNEEHQEAKIESEKYGVVSAEIHRLGAKYDALKYKREQAYKAKSAKSIKNEIRFLNKERERIANEVFPMEDKALKKSLGIAKLSLKENQHELSKLQEEHDLNQWLINDPLSNSGLKAYIFDTMLAWTNRELKKYTPYAGFDVKITINLSSARKDFMILVYQDKSEVPYDDLSGGQQQLLSVCIALAVHDSISDTKSFNILAMDEVFESLSADNVDKVGEILNQKSQGKCLHIITHKEEFNPVGAHYTYLELDSRKHTQFSAS